MHKKALLLDGIHLKRYWRILGQLGLFRSAFLILLFIAGFAYISQPHLLVIQSLVVIFALAGVHWKRNDKAMLINLGVNHPFFFLIQYGIFMLPFALFYLICFSLIPFLILLSGWLLISFLKRPSQSIIFTSFKIRFTLLPAQCWEWRAGLKLNWWIMAGILSISVVFYNQIIVLMVAMVLLSLMAADFQSNHEQTLMIKALRLTVHKFLRLKILWQTFLFTLIVSPILILFLIQFSDSYMLLIMAFSASLMVQICAILFKYSAFEQGEKTSLFVGILALLNISFLLPPLAPLPLILILVFYKKSLQPTEDLSLMLEIIKLSFSYGHSLVIDQLDWATGTGKVHGLVGMNGAGKTTLFRLITGGLTSKRGNLIFKKKPLDYNDCAFMETHPVFYPMITGKEYLQVFTLKNKHFDIGKWNAIFNLPLNEVVDNYSTGMQKKLSLMSIMALNRPLLILDEPFNGLDFEAVKITRRIIQKLAENGKTIILSSHIPETLTQVCDTLSMMDKGKIVFQLSKPEFDKFEALSETLLHNAPLPDIEG